MVAHWRKHLACAFTFSSTWLVLAGLIEEETN